ncbi:protein S40-5 isoform X1 [Hevea brasiliensis]|nr:protein S40-5 isoform X1 [Hevea brasiliensis]
MLQISPKNLRRTATLGGSQSKKRQSSMDNSYNFMRQGTGVWRSLREGDFEEEDVWDVLRETKDANSNYGKSTESSFSVPRSLPSAARMIPRTTSSGSSSSSNNSSHETKVVPQSAPVNIPDWSKFCKRKTKKASKNASSLHYEDYDEDHESDGDSYNGVVNEDNDDEYENKDSDYYFKLPPHELIARRLARSQISSFSVFEGVGRTLKGRDLSKVRNAVLTRTGFLESP